MTEDKKTVIEDATRKCIDRLKNKKVNRLQVDALLDTLYGLDDEKSIMDYLALKVDKAFFGASDSQDYIDSINDILTINNTIYNSPEALLEQLQKNKKSNYVPGKITVEDDHRLIFNTLKTVCDRFNDAGVDYYVVGALSTFIGTQTTLFRYHEDIDFLISEDDISKVQNALDNSEYTFLDNRLNNSKILTPGVGNTQGEHEVIAHNKNNEFNLGFFLFRREKDNSMTMREYFMEQNSKGEKIPKILERHLNPELVNLEYSKDVTHFAGTAFKTSTPESVFLKKMGTSQDKDLLDLDALRDKVDFKKMCEIQKYQPTLRVVDLVEEEDKSASQNVIFTEDEIGKATRNISVEEKDKVKAIIEKLISSSNNGNGTIEVNNIK